MQQQRHFQLSWDEEQQDQLSRFYDYKKSYYDLMERLPDRSVQLAVSDARSDSDADEPAASAATGETDEDDSDWEDCSSDAGCPEEMDQQKLEAMLHARGWNCARVTDEGLLQLPNGQEVLHRAHAIYCRQRLRRVEPQTAEQCVLQDMARISSPVPVINNSSKSSLLYKRQKLQRQLGLRGGTLLLRHQQLLLLPQRQRRLMMQRETEQQQKRQQLRMKVGIKANKLQRAMLRETKCFL